MEYEILKKYLEEGLSLNQITTKENKSLTTIRYWVKKHKLKPNFKSFKEDVFNKPKAKDCSLKYCPRCKQTFAKVNFYKRRGVEGNSVYCKKCTNLQTTERQKELKIQMVKYKGGKCQNPKCSTPGGYNRCIGALEFHHLNPKEKDFHPSNLKRYSFNETVRSELDKCILVCATCHREIHDEINQKK